MMLHDGPRTAAMTVVLAHGAGAGMDTPFMTRMAEGLAETGLHVVRFEFPYMQRRRAEGGRRPPDRQPVLLDCWREVIAELGEPGRLVIGGKSMGGRMASLIADEAGVAGLVCLGYPFHPAGKPERTRTEHLEGLATPALILQGERDALGNREDVEGYSLSPAIAMHWLADGNHDLKPRKASGRDHEQNLAEAMAAIAAFVKALQP
ncbi:MAG: alpha/beta fold hydrolase [Alphaproteobacteria bacterium]|nr:alpha/beta fold hydrolase [Alphaproteobacteria bacterium]